MPPTETSPFEIAPTASAEARRTWRCDDGLAAEAAMVQGLVEKSRPIAKTIAERATFVPPRSQLCEANDGSAAVCVTGVAGESGAGPISAGTREALGEVNAGLFTNSQESLVALRPWCCTFSACDLDSRLNSRRVHRLIGRCSLLVPIQAGWVHCPKPSRIFVETWARLRVQERSRGNIPGHFSRVRPGVPPGLPLIPPRQVVGTRRRHVPERQSKR